MEFKFRNTEDFRSVCVKYFSFRNETDSTEPIRKLLPAIRNADFSEFLDFLKENPEITENLSQYIHQLFKGKPFNLSLTEANILSENAFYPELKKRLLDKFLPAIENEQTVWYLVDTISVRPKKDLEFFHNQDQDQLDELFRLLRIDRFIGEKFVKKELYFSLNILAWRALGNALDVEVVNMAPNYRNLDNPFVAMQNEIDSLTKDFQKNPDFVLSSKDPHYKQIRIYLTQCFTFVGEAFKNSSKYGISGKINQFLLKIRQQLARINDILAVLVIDKEEDALQNSKQLFFNILEYKSHKNNVAELFSDSTTLISHLITNHTAETGSHYITSTRRDYLKMFLRASGGGVIVGALCVLKLLYSYIPGSDFSHAFLYALNYAMGFIMIYLMNYTLATKQPAMTAATMAKVLSEGKNTRKNYVDFAHLVSKVFQSQFIAFMGNVLLAFPVALAIIYGVDVIFKENFAFDKSTKLLTDLDPFQSKAIFHASIAGFFLFLSGIISGNIGNSSVFYRIPERIAKNPSLNYFFGERISKNISDYYSKNWAGIVSNFWFGIFLGVTGPVGLFLGLDLDIRHITFASGNFALGLYGKEFSVSHYAFWISFITVFLIGFFNFAVSFGLSMILAFRSRQVKFGDMKEIYREILRYFMKNPLRFFIPLRSELDKSAKELVEKTVATKPKDH